MQHDASGSEEGDTEEGSETEDSDRSSPGSLMLDEIDSSCSQVEETDSDEEEMREVEGSPMEVDSPASREDGEEDEEHLQEIHEEACWEALRLYLSSRNPADEDVQQVRLCGGAPLYVRLYLRDYVVMQTLLRDRSGYEDDVWECRKEHLVCCLALGSELHDISRKNLRITVQ